eukprot:1140232-Rhodomonas_salina.1
MSDRTQAHERESEKERKTESERKTATERQRERERERASEREKQALGGRRAYLGGSCGERWSLSPVGSPAHVPHARSRGGGSVAPVR